MDHELSWIRETLASFGERGPGFRYPAEFRRRVVRYAARRLVQTTTTAVTREVGLSGVTIKRWRDAPSRQEEETVSVERAAQAMVPVRITGMEPTVGAAGSVAVITPSGWRVEGLSLTEVIELLKRCA